MAVDPELGKALNLLRASPDFALQHRDDGSSRVFNPAEITPDMGVVSVFAHLILANGQTVPAVIQIDAAVNDIPRATYIWAANQWFEPAAPEDRVALFTALDATERAVFPYSWSTHIPLNLT